MTLLALALALAPSLAHADEPARADRAAPPGDRAPVTEPRGAWRSFRAGAELVSGVKSAAIFEGVWSISLQGMTTLVSRTWDAPYPAGTIGQYFTRLLYGTSWTLMLGFESLAVVAASKGRLDWLGAARYRADWIFGLDLPACPRPGAMAGCGLGVGTLSFLQIRPRGSRWWYEAGGGWIQQRVSSDELRTLTESTWVLTPFSATRELATDPDRAVALRAFVGPGVHLGMHAAHVHPTMRGSRVHDVRWTEMYPLEQGIGPGARVEAQLVFAQHLTLQAELVVAPLLLGGSSRHVARAVAPLDFEREGVPVWRRLGAGIGWRDPRAIPFEPTLALFGAELSARRFDRLGYRGVMLRFDVPLEVPGGS